MWGWRRRAMTATSSPSRRVSAQDMRALGAIFTATAPPVGRCTPRKTEEKAPSPSFSPSKKSSEKLPSSRRWARGSAGEEGELRSAFPTPALPAPPPLLLAACPLLPLLLLAGWGPP